MHIENYIMKKEKMKNNEGNYKYLLIGINKRLLGLDIGRSRRITFRYRPNKRSSY